MIAMRENIPWREARDLLLSLAKETDIEETGPDECAGRVLAFDLTASGDVPPFDRSAYDGYAMRSQDLEGAGKGTVYRRGYQERKMREVCS